ncbi:hypothetical protein ACFL1F_01090 [Chlamydiota bacterium]
MISILTVILTAILVVITGVYVWLTFRILKANEKTVVFMRDQSESLTRPYVNISVVIYPQNSLFYLKIANTGRSTAEKLRMKIGKDFYQYGMNQENRNLRKFSAFSEEIDSFHPGAEMQFGLAQGFVLFGDEADLNLTPTRFEIETEYIGNGKKYYEIIPIDLSPYSKSILPHDPYVDQLSKICKAIEKK